MTPVSNLRPSPIAGTWYPGDPASLARQVDDFIHSARLPDNFSGEVVGLVAPHAGHRYSGRTAGHAFRSVLGLSPQLVVVVSPLHAYHPAPFLTSAHPNYATPLGAVPVDRQAVATVERYLQQNSTLSLTAISNDHEHSLEIELPFLQRALAGPFQLLPIMIRDQSPQAAQVLGEAVALAARNRPSLLVASTDLSHFYPVGIARELDAEMLRQIAKFSPEGVLNAEQTASGFACGAAAVAAVLLAARELGGNAVEILHYSTSADETGDDRAVVGYGAAAILKKA